MSFKVALAHTCHPEDGDVISLVNDVVIRAKKQHADIVVFPESLMSKFEIERQAFLKEAQNVDGAFSRSIDAIASEHGVWIVYTMNEANQQDARPFNTAILSDATGVKRAVYRKIHLFDSSSIKESERMSSSDNEPSPAETPFGTIGLGICYDLRFPEYARRQALNGCELLVFPAAWVDGPQKELQWKTLLQARAIENEIFVAGVSRADKGYVGTGYVFAPDGKSIASPIDRDLLIAEIDLGEIENMRNAIPCLEHRRPELY